MGIQSVVNLCEGWSMFMLLSMNSLFLWWWLFKRKTGKAWLQGRKQMWIKSQDVAGYSGGVLKHPHLEPHTCLWFCLLCLNRWGGFVLFLFYSSEIETFSLKEQVQYFLFLWQFGRTQLSFLLLQPGDRVVGIVDMQAWAELVCIPAQFVYHMPSGMSFQDGAALLMNYLTAHLLLFDIGNLRNGQSVLVHSVGGGVVSTRLCCTFPNSFQDRQLSISLWGAPVAGWGVDFGDKKDAMLAKSVLNAKNQTQPKISSSEIDQKLLLLNIREENSGLSSGFLGIHLRFNSLPNWLHVFWTLSRKYGA